jgi:hypothetical protein
MSKQVEAIIEETVEQLKPLFVSYAQAVWQAAITGTEEANKREEELQATLMRFWATPERYAGARRLHEEGAATEPLQARQVKLIYLSAAKAQQDEETIQKLTRLEAEVRQKYYNFRGRVDGQELPTTSWMRSSRRARTVPRSARPGRRASRWASRWPNRCGSLLESATQPPRPKVIVITSRSRSHSTRSTKTS